MDNAPKAITERYISNLIHNGRNREFDIDSVVMEEHVVETTVVGYFYRVRLLAKTDAEVGVGATIAAAVRNALHKFGVTFRN